MGCGWSIGGHDPILSALKSSRRLLAGQKLRLLKFNDTTHHGSSHRAGLRDSCCRRMSHVEIQTDTHSCFPELLEGIPGSEPASGHTYTHEAMVLCWPELGVDTISPGQTSRAGFRIHEQITGGQIAKQTPKPTGSRDDERRPRRLLSRLAETWNLTCQDKPPSRPHILPETIHGGLEDESGVLLCRLDRMSTASQEHLHRVVPPSLAFQALPTSSRRLRLHTSDTHHDPSCNHGRASGVQKGP